ncbi:MAG: efflux RND transporter periplasmic adaptor subunit [Paracoccaceae bacterium]
MKALRLFRLLPPIAVGVGIAVFLISRAQPPERLERPELHAVVSTLRVAPEKIAPMARGYGTVTPARNWAAVAEVSGAITWRHPDLETGKLIRAGTVVLRVDASSYEIALAQAEADLKALQAERAQLDVENGNTARLLEIETTRLDLAEADLSRTKALVEQGNAPQSLADERERAALQIRRGTQELANALALIPSRRARVAAQISRAESQLARARRDLERTRIAAPFDIRVGTVDVEAHQFVAAGQKLMSGDGVDAAEVTAQIPLDAFPRLVGAVQQGSGTAALEGEATLARIAARLTLVSDRSQSWEARVVRVGNALDPQARSVPVTVSVADPYAGMNPPERLPLVPNMYVELTLTGPAGARRIRLPDHAMHEGGIVYLRDAEGRLELRPVEVAFRQDGYAVIDAGLSPGEEVVLDDLTPAIPGMRLVAAEPLQ